MHVPCRSFTTLTDIKKRNKVMTKPIDGILKPRFRLKESKRKRIMIIM